MDYDSPWKEALEQYFESFMEFFFPDIYADIAWSKGYEFLDKELEKVVRDAEIGRRIADKLVKIYLPDGKETWLLIHIEVQGYYEAEFARRMYIYNYRLFDRYKTEIVSLAVLTDANYNYRPDGYFTGRWGCELRFSFPVIKVLDYGKNWDAMEKNRNPFAIVVMAHLKAQELGKGKENERKRWKLRLSRMLYESGYERHDILELFRFIDWLMVLPEELDNDFWKELKQIEEEEKMPYVTSVERIGIKQGVQQGLYNAGREILFEVAGRHFGAVPEDVTRAINEIDNYNKLKFLVIQAMTCETVDDFRKFLKQP